MVRVRVFYCSAFLNNIYQVLSTVTSESSTQTWSSHTSNMVTENREDPGSAVIDSSPKVAINFNVVTPRVGPSEELISDG